MRAGRRGPPLLPSEPIQPNPHSFFVSGLRECEVRSYAEAVELLNWGLQNRVMASNIMNFTSSRSHTILTATVQQRLSPSKTIRGKVGALVFCSVRVERICWI